MLTTNLHDELDALFHAQMENRSDISQYFSIMNSASRGKANIGFFDDGNSMSNIVVSDQKHGLDKVTLKDAINFSTSNYLGLGQDPDVVAAAKNAIDQFGTGANGSPVLSGYYQVHHELERQLSLSHHCDDTMITSSGFIANIIVMTSLFNKGDTIYLEKNTHGSIIMGAGLSGAKIKLYSENDFEKLEKLLQKDSSNRKLIVTCGVFSMTGLISDLPRLSHLAKQYKALLMIDDAHGLGVIGEKGLGTLDHFNMKSSDVDIHVGTLSKSLSACGGYITGSKELIRFLRVSALPYLLSASIPPAVTASALAALTKLQSNGKQMSAELRSRVQFFKTCLNNLNIDNIGESAIVVIPISNAEKTMAASNYLQDHGIYANGIIPPGVRKGDERIRFNITLTHDYADLEYTANTVAKALKELAAEQDNPMSKIA